MEDGTIFINDKDKRGVEDQVDEEDHDDDEDEDEE